MLFACLLLLVTAVQHAMVMFHYPRWSPDGKWIVLSSNIDGEDEEVWVISADGQTRRKLTNNTVTDSGADWLPDGKRITFRRPTGERFDEFVMNADGSNLQPYQPAAAPAMRGITVSERQSGGRQDVIVQRNGAAERVINRVSWAEQPSVSPDGTMVVFEQRDSPHDIINSDVAIWDVKTGQLRILARGTDPSWSPDGRTLLFKAPDKTQALFITVADVASGKTRTLAPGVHPHFSPDGRQIVYMDDRSARADVYMIGIDGGAPRCLTCSWK